MSRKHQDIPSALIICNVIFTLHRLPQIKTGRLYKQSPFGYVWLYPHHSTRICSAVLACLWSYCFYNTTSCFDWKLVFREIQFSCLCFSQQLSTLSFTFHMLIAQFLPPPCDTFWSYTLILDTEEAQLSFCVWKEYRKAPWQWTATTAGCGLSNFDVRKQQ